MQPIVKVLNNATDISRLDSSVYFIIGRGGGTE